MSSLEDTNERPNTLRQSDENSAPIHEIGVLLVHGIGQQRRGETLVDYGEPMVRWIQQWIDGSSLLVTEENFSAWLGSLESSRQTPSSSCGEIANPELDVLSHLYASNVEGLELRRVLARVISRYEGARSRGLGGNAEAISQHRYIRYIGGLAQVSHRFREKCPPNFSVDIEIVNVRGEIEKSSWLFAEAYWAESFPIPNVMKVSAWSLLVAPWVIANYFGTGISRAFHGLTSETGGRFKWKRVVALLHCMLHIVLIPTLIPFLVAVEILLVLVLILGAIPLDPLRKYLDRILRTFAAVIGDCFAFASSPLRTAMIVDQVKNDMDWLAKRCKHLVIVAHSQGAAVVYLTLATSRPANLRMLVTLGSGLRKLISTRKLDMPGITDTKLAIFLGCFITIYLVYACLRYLLPPIVWLPALQIGGLSGLEVGMIAGTILIFALLWLGYGAEEHDVEFWGWAESLRSHGCRWLDCFSSKDPVADGPTFDPTGELGSKFRAPDNWRPLEVQNTGSLFSDHNSYMTNRDQCLAEIICEITSYTNCAVPLHSLTSGDKIVIAKESQKRQFRIDQLRFLRMTSMILFGIVVWARWSQMTELGTWLDLRFDVSHSVYVIEWLWNAFDNPQQMLGIVGVAGLVFLLWLMPKVGWSVWNRFETWLFFQRLTIAKQDGDLLSSIFLNLGFSFYIAMFSGFVLTVAYVAWFWPIGVSPIVAIVLEVIVAICISALMKWHEVTCAHSP